MIDPFGPGPSAPEIVASWQMQNLPSGTGLLDFGNIQQGSVVQRILRIHNQGNANLVLQPANIAGGFTLASNFTLNQIVLPGDSAFLTVQIDSSNVMNSTGQVSFATNDADELTYQVSLSGSVNTPLVVASINGSTTRSEGDPTPVTATITRTYVSDISQPLVVTLTSTNTAAFYTPMTVTIPANSMSATITLQIINDGAVDGTQAGDLVPQAVGFRSQSAALSVTNDDTIENKTLGGRVSGVLPAGTYRVIQSVFVDADQTWTVSPGTRLLFEPNTKLSVSGTLLAQGTSLDPILFSSGKASPKAGD
ncbi:MAG: DUF1573 domain-containing protein, partial [Planctomycetes bacterium]|nr:DUF1573 domain-containing protein [Planctomycetota bacterium]